jgi:hypothetical protein
MSCIESIKKILLMKKRLADVTIPLMLAGQSGRGTGIEAAHKKIGKNRS